MVSQRAVPLEKDLISSRVAEKWILGLRCCREKLRELVVFGREQVEYPSGLSSLYEGNRVHYYSVGPGCGPPEGGNHEIIRKIKIFTCVPAYLTGILC